jgi:hypothetical protein
MNCFINVFLVIGIILLGITIIIWLVQGVFIIKKSLNDEENDFACILKKYKNKNKNK